MLYITTFTSDSALTKSVNFHFATAFNLYKYLKNSMILYLTSTYHILLRMKKSWMKMQPNGKTPPIRIPGRGRV